MSGLPLLFKKVSPWYYKRWTWDEKLEVEGKRECVWLHVLSLGELFSISKLPELLRQAFPDYDILVTVSTQKAYDYYKTKGFSHTKFTHMPLDFFVPIKRFLDSIRPKVVLIVESDLWPFILWKLNSKKIPIFLINGRMSPRTLQNYKRFKLLLRPLFSPITKWIMQSEEGAKKLLKTGVVSSDKIISVGNLKYDTLLNRQEITQINFRQLFGFSEDDVVWIAGSTHPGEEEIVFKAYNILRRSHPLLRLVTAPRDIGRAQELLSLAQREGLVAVRRSEVGEKKGNNVIILDTVGELRSLYGIAQIAFVGGSLVPIGGHNILEPAVYEVPVIFGPFMFNFEEMAQEFLSKEAAYAIRDLDGMLWAVKTLVENPSWAREMGRRGKEICLSHRGATQRLLEIIGRHI